MFCSQCGKKVLDSMLYCPFCGAAIIIPEQEPSEDKNGATPEPVKAEPAFSFDAPSEPARPTEPAPQPEAEKAEELAPEMHFPWDIPEEVTEGEPEPEPEPKPEAPFPWELPEEVTDEEPEPMPEPKPEPEPEPEPEPVKPAKKAAPRGQNLDRRTAKTGNVVPGRRTNETLVPDKASVFLDDVDDFEDDFDDTDDYDDFEEEVERASRKGKSSRGYSRRYRDEDLDDEDDEDDVDDEDRSFISRHIRGIVGILLFLVLLAVLMFYALSDAGQLSLAKINATLPLRAEIYSRVAYEYYQNGEYSQSGVYYERALSRDADSYNYASSAAMAYIAAGNNDKAAEMLKKCIQLKPEAVEPYLYLLNLYPNENSRPWDVAQLIRQGYERTGDARLEVADDGSAQG